jgi:hypothetical protein
MSAGACAASATCGYIVHRKMLSFFAPATLSTVGRRFFCSGVDQAALLPASFWRTTLGT